MTRALSLRALRGLRVSSTNAPPSSPWICSRCRSRSNKSSRWSSSTSSLVTPKEKPYYITTPIFYVNAAPHIGHLYSMVLTDVIKRWQQINGRQAMLCTGTDEHGMKVQQAANKAGVDPKQFCDGNSQKFRDLAAAANISDDFFVRTTDAEHIQAVKQFWLHLKHNPRGHLGLYEGAHQGWYCVSDECFYPEDMVRLGLRNQTGEKVMISTETENEVEWVSEKTWFFPLKKYKEALLKFYDDNPGWIQPRHRMNEVREWVENHLEDLSITRSASRLSWGIADPDDPSQTIYVWVDALINYLTKAGYGSQWTSLNPGADQGLWPADLQVIGKDILRFHAVYWPALLMAVGLPLPKRILCHNHWTMSNRKMSKSIGNVVNPHFAMDRWDVDPLRYFLMRNGSFTKDMDYSNELISVVYEKDLKANIGNLLLRVARPKSNQRWSTAEAVRAYRDGECDGLASSNRSEGHASADFVPHLLKATPEFSARMEELDCAAAIRTIFELLRETNRFVSDVEPWKLAKMDGAETKRLLNWVIFQCSEALRIAGILLQPIMPTKASLLLDQLGVKPERRTVDFATMGKDTEYGMERPEGRLDTVKGVHALFPPLANQHVPDNEMLEQVSSAFHGRTKNKGNQMAALLAMEAAKGEGETAEWLASTAEKKKEAQRARRP